MAQSKCGRYSIRDRIYYGRLFIGSKNKVVQVVNGSQVRASMITGEHSELHNGKQAGRDQQLSHIDYMGHVMHDNSQYEHEFDRYENACWDAQYPHRDYYPDHDYGEFDAHGYRLGPNPKHQFDRQHRSEVLMQRQHQVVQELANSDNITICRDTGMQIRRKSAYEGRSQKDTGFPQLLENLEKW